MAVTTRRASNQVSFFDRQIIVGDKQQTEAMAKKESLGDLDDVAKRAIRQEEDDAKSLLIAKESENFTRIYALKCYNGWLKILDHSALIVSVKLDGKLGKSYRRCDDNGYGKARAKYGVVSIPPESVGDFIVRLHKAGIPLVSDDLAYLEFELGERIEKEEMIKMIHMDELLIDKTNKLVMPREVLPNLRANVKELLNFTHSELRDHKDSVKEMFLNDVERMVIDINKLIIATARGNIEIKKALTEMQKFVEETYANATTMCDMGIISAGHYRTFVNLVIRVENEVSREIKRMAVKEFEKNAKK